MNQFSFYDYFKMEMNQLAKENIHTEKGERNSTRLNTDVQVVVHGDLRTRTYIHTSDIPTSVHTNDFFLPMHIP